MSRVAVVGLGLIGGALARALREMYDGVVGVDPDPHTQQLARAAGLTLVADVRDALDDVELIVVATPLAMVAETVRALAETTCTVTDVASVKGPVLAAARAAGLAGRFVGGHPMAGTQHSGFAAGTSSLFAGAPWLLGLEPDTDLHRWLAVAALATDLGARVVPGTAAEHDDAVARISHLPHLIAATLTSTATAAGPLALTLAAGSFRDATRVAAADPSLATAMCALNPDAIDAAVAAFTAGLTDPDRAGTVAAGHRARLAWPPGPSPKEIWPTDRPDLASQLLALGRRGGWVETVRATRLAVCDPG